MRKEIWVMPEEKDEEFSLVLIKRLHSFVESFNIEAFTLEISEKYSTEGTPHFHMKVGFGLSIDLPCNEMRISYDASANNVTYHGSMNIIVGADAPGPIRLVLTAMAFGLYDEAICQFYPEWVTDYDVNSILLR